MKRLPDKHPAKTVAEWTESLVPLEGRCLFTKEGRKRLEVDQLNPRDSRARKRA